MSDLQGAFYLRLLVALSRYSDLEDDDLLDDALDVLPRPLATEFVRRLLRILAGEDARDVFELPRSSTSGGRPPESMRDLCIAIQYAQLHYGGEEKAVVARRLLSDSWRLPYRTVERITRRYSSDSLEVMARLHPAGVDVGGFSTLVAIAERFRTGSKKPG